MSKYGNRITEINGIRFASKREAMRYRELALLEMAGEIRDLQLQYPFELIPAIKEKGKVIARAVKYIADFVYYDRDGNLVVEDAKGMQTDVYKLKKKIVRWKFGIEIREV